MNISDTSVPLPQKEHSLVMTELKSSYFPPKATPFGNPKSELGSWWSTFKIKLFCGFNNKKIATLVARDLEKGKLHFKDLHWLSDNQLSLLKQKLESKSAGKEPNTTIETFVKRAACCARKESTQKLILQLLGKTVFEGLYAKPKAPDAKQKDSLEFETEINEMISIITKKKDQKPEKELSTIIYYSCQRATVEKRFDLIENLEKNLMASLQESTRDSGEEKLIREAVKADFEEAKSKQKIILSFQESPSENPFISAIGVTKNEWDSITILARRKEGGESATELTEEEKRKIECFFIHIFEKALLHNYYIINKTYIACNSLT